MTGPLFRSPSSTNCSASRGCTTVKPSDATVRRDYLGGCALAGAALEALLLAMVHLYREEVEAAARVAKVRGKPKPLLEWNLGELLEAAAGASWLPAGLKRGSTWDSRRARIGDYAEALRQIRNLVHPGCYLREHSPSRVTSRYLARSLDIVSVAVEHFEARVHECLRRAMEAEA